MTAVAFGRIVMLANDKGSGDSEFRIGLAELESATGRLVADAEPDYDGLGNRFQPGDVLFGKLRPYLAKAWLADREGEAVGDFHIYRPRDLAETDAAFLRWTVLSRAFLDPVESSVFGAKMPRADWEFVRSIEVFHPSVAEQRAVAHYLDRETARIDELIAEQERLIELLVERFVARRRALLGPSLGWSTSRVKHFADTSLGKMLDAGKAAKPGEVRMPYVRAADIRADNSINLQDLNEMPFSADEMARLGLRAGDVLLIEGGATVGRPGLVEADVDGISFQKTVNRLRVTGAMDPGFVFWSLLERYESDYYSTHFPAVSFVHLTGEKLREVEVGHPGLDEQRRIARLLDTDRRHHDALVSEAERFIELSREHRSALITAAVTGQIDVREEVA